MSIKDSYKNRQRSTDNGQRTTDNGSHPFIPYARQQIDEDDIQAVVEVLRSDWITQGPKVKEFEQAFANYVGSRFAVAVNSGTAALHLACLAAGLGPGDEVLTSPITFVATANCALYVGARPAFVDIDPATYNLDPSEFEMYLNKKAISRKNGPNPRAVIPVHFAGLPCNMPEIHRIARKFNLVIIEDACHALGAKYKNWWPGGSIQELEEDTWIKVGSCADSDMTVFSFHPVKHITTGEGGMITTNDEKLYKQILLLRSHGITRDPEKFVHRSLFTGAQQTTENGQRITPAWYYEMQALSYNYRSSDIQCALGLSQLRKIESFVERRRFIAKQYSEFLKNFPGFRPQMEVQGCKSSYHLYVICLDGNARIGRNEVMNDLRRVGIGTQVHYIPVYQHPLYQGLGFLKGNCQEAEIFFSHCLSIPVYPAMSDEDVNRVLNALEVVGRKL